tara:strand:- start:48 stop:410 length:363 start_codon:yes stop_codon:yes gene_type:complete
LKPKQSTVSHPEKYNKVLLNIYGILAVIIVLIPEWLAELLLALEHKEIKQIYIKRSAWKNYPSMRIESMSLREIRHMANKMNLIGYSSDSRKLLSRRILKKLKRTRVRKLLKKIRTWNTL